MINAGFPPGHQIPLTAICGAGVALAWLANEPSGLLVAAVGISLGGKRASLWSAAVFGLALAAFILVAGWGSLAGNEISRRLAVFFAAGLGISRADPPQSNHQLFRSRRARSSPHRGKHAGTRMVRRCERQVRLCQPKHIKISRPARQNSGSDRRRG